MRTPSFVLILLILFLRTSLAQAETLDRDMIETFVAPPMSLGERLNDEGVWQLLNSGGADAGYVFETEPMAPCPGFPVPRSICWSCLIWRGDLLTSG